jgi:hypothetical protein
MPRTVRHRYDDPVDLIWRAAAAQIGWKIAESPDCYASWDGRDTLTVSVREGWDADDSLAQLLLHEMCHALVQGEARRRRPDWGLDNSTDTSSALEEHACHRLQAALLDRYGLRDVLAVTTDWRPYWDALPDDPLGEGDDPAIALARAAWPEAARGRWSAALDAALRATAQIASAARGLAPADALWRLARPLGPLGTAAHPTARCGTCAWATPEDGVAPHALRCLAEAAPAQPGPVVSADGVGCYRHEPRLTVSDCRACGACCRQGYHLVGVEPDEPAAQTGLATPDRWGGLSVPRPDGYCAALAQRCAPWTCTIYDRRPSACAEFEVAGEACLTARRRVGLSRT